MAKNVVVVFKNTGARILVNPEPADYEKETSYVINPDLTSMKGIPPHEWRLDGDTICAYDPEKGEIEAPQDVEATVEAAVEVGRLLPRVVKTRRRIKWTTVVICVHTLVLIGLIVYTIGK